VALDVLLVRAGALGDVLLLRPVLAALRAAGHRPRLLAPAAPAAALLGPGPAEVDSVLDWDGTEMAGILAGEETSGAVASSLGEAGAVVAWTRSQPLVAALAPRVRRLLVHDPTPPPGGGHASAWLARPLAELGVASVESVPSLQFTEAETQASAAFTRSLPPRFLAVHAGSGSPAKNWPRERFLALADRLASGCPWLLVEGPAEERAASAPSSAVVARALPLRVLGALLSRAGVYVGNDSGVTHLAAAAGAKTLALFGPTDPATWAPLGGAVRTLRAAGGELRQLDVGAVLEAARGLLARSAASELPSG
jgi:ADP-heptose:LPS heptosyltransferase